MSCATVQGTKVTAAAWRGLWWQLAVPSVDPEVMAKIYTRKGDGGQTWLFTGEQVAKDEARLEALGCIDELVAFRKHAEQFQRASRLESQIMGILRSNTHYPPEAKARHEEGVSNIAFSLNRQGHLTSARIARSSGSPALDADALGLVRRVQPFPPPPPEVVGAQNQITLNAPIRYYLTN
jgi:TonB family protein